MKSTDFVYVLKEINASFKHTSHLTLKIQFALVIISDVVKNHRLFKNCLNLWFSVYAKAGVLFSETVRYLRIPFQHNVPVACPASAMLVVVTGLSNPEHSTCHVRCWIRSMYYTNIQNGIAICPTGLAQLRKWVRPKNFWSLTSTKRHPLIDQVLHA